MSFRLTTLKTISKLCSSNSNAAPIFKKISPSMTFKQASSTLYYKQSRGYIFLLKLTNLSSVFSGMKRVKNKLNKKILKKKTKLLLKNLLKNNNNLLIKHQLNKPLRRNKSLKNPLMFFLKIQLKIERRFMLCGWSLKKKQAKRLKN